MAALMFFFMLLCVTAVAETDIPASSPSYNLREKGTVEECWEALKELTACANEILDFLINGVGNLAPPCCAAVETITQGCWPAMLTAAGISEEEGNTLLGYCKKEVADTAPAMSPVLQYFINHRTGE